MNRIFMAAKTGPARVKFGLVALCCLVSAGCANIGGGIGLSLPIGPLGSVGVNIGSDGRIGGSLGVGVGGLSVGVGTSGKLPAAKAPDEVSKVAD